MKRKKWIKGKERKERASKLIAIMLGASLALGTAAPQAAFAADLTEEAAEEASTDESPSPEEAASQAEAVETEQADADATEDPAAAEPLELETEAEERAEVEADVTLADGDPKEDIDVDFDWEAGDKEVWLVKGGAEVSVSMRFYCDDDVYESDLRSLAFALTDSGNKPSGLSVSTPTLTELTKSNGQWVGTVTTKLKYTGTDLFADDDGDTNYSFMLDKDAADALDGGVYNSFVEGNDSGEVEVYVKAAAATLTVANSSSYWSKQVAYGKSLTWTVGYSYTGTKNLKATVGGSTKGLTISKPVWDKAKKQFRATVKLPSTGANKKKWKPTMTITDGTLSKTSKLEVVGLYTSVKSVKLNKSTASIKKGKTVALKATISPSNATNKNVTWKTSNKKIATVTSKGVVKGVKKGKATITVTTKDGKKTKSCKVTVK